MASLPAVNRQTNSATQNSLLQPWQTAVDLASLAVTAEENRYGHTAEDLADHEVHQAIKSALNQAQLDVQRRMREPEPRRLLQIVEQRQQTVNQDRANIKSLTSAPGADQNNDLDLLNAQLNLDLEELNNEKQSLTQALEDRTGELERELAVHDANVKKYDAAQAAKTFGAIATSQRYDTVARRLKAWFDQRSRHDSLEHAADAAQASATLLATDQSQLKQLPSSAISDVAEDSKTRMKAMDSASMHKRMMFIAIDRMQSQNLLAQTYRKWAAQVLIQHRIVFHLLMQSLSLLGSVLLAALLLDFFIRRYLAQSSITTARLGRNQYSLRVMLRLAVAVVTALLVFLILFGPPTELSTFIGLITAGLTVVLQDFIISFCGWFVLMGKDGVRIGDWVEIDGIAGEVVSIGIFRTAVLETGNWTDLGHPTGRRITFANSFAIKGRYFNFTTNGQWMWDELTVNVSADEAYGTVELIHKVVLEETQANSQQAENEWRLAGRTGGLGQISTLATVNMRPSASGIDIVVRYVTRASARSEMRNLLYHQVLEVIHKPVSTQVPDAV